MNSGERVFVAGGTGTAGRAYGRAFKAQGYDVRASARDADGAAALAELGIEPVAVDLTDSEATSDAIKGAMKVVVALLGRGEKAAAQEETITRNVIDAAARNGVEHLVYTSVYTADRPTGVPHFVVKDVLERYLAQAAVPATVLRPATFMDAFATPWLREGLLDRGVLVSPIAIDAPISYIATADLADVAVGVLGDPDLLGATIEVGGPRPVTYRELLPLLSELVGRGVRYEQLPIEQVQAQFGSDMAAMVRLFNEEGFVVDPSPVVDRFGLQLTTVEEFLHQTFAAPAGASTP
jgi:uncharacterized protein YbjT (DUF2867 family)